MKVLITEDTLDSLLSIKISSDGGKTYTDYEVSSLKNGGLTFDCSSNDLKVICDANVLKYIQVLADGEKSTISNVDLSDYIKIKDVYIDVYKNPYYGVKLSQEEVDNLSEFDRYLYEDKRYKYYCSSENFMILALKYDTRLVPSKDDSIYYYSSGFFAFLSASDKKNNNNFFLDYNVSDLHPERLDDFYYVYIEKSIPYLSDEVFRANVRVHFIKHF